MGAVSSWLRWAVGAPVSTSVGNGSLALLTPPEPVSVDAVEDAYRVILSSVGLGATDGTADTPRRAAAAFRELTSGYDIDIAGLFTTFEAEAYDEMVIVKDISFSSLCEHHALPFIGRAHIAYIPDGRIVGLSKMSRLVDAYARRLQVQERLTCQVADALMEHLNPVGVCVVMEAEHLCMSMRGVKAPGSLTMTSALRGALIEKPEARAEALSLIRG